MSKEKKLLARHENMSLKIYKFDLEVKGQRRIGIMNVHDTSFHGDAPMYGKPISTPKQML